MAVHTCLQATQRFHSHLRGSCVEVMHRMRERDGHLTKYWSSQEMGSMRPLAHMKRPHKK